MNDKKVIIGATYVHHSIKSRKLIPLRKSASDGYYDVEVSFEYGSVQRFTSINKMVILINYKPIRTKKRLG